MVKRKSIGRLMVTAVPPKDGAVRCNLPYGRFSVYESEHAYLRTGGKSRARKGSLSDRFSGGQRRQSFGEPSDNIARITSRAKTMLSDLS